MSSRHLLSRCFGWFGAHPRVLGVIALLLLAVGGAAGGLAFGSWHSVCRDCPSIAQISVWEPLQSTQIFAHDGRLIHELYRERRTPVSLGDLPPHVPRAFLAIEDKRFYRHHGLDYVRIFGAAVGNVLSGRVTGGASTITQQLARNIFAADIEWLQEIEGSVSFWQRLQRKLKEIHVALQLEQVYTKDQILEAYLNQVYFGHGWHGIETAAHRYFGKPARELNPAEAATLAGVIKLWGRYSPFRNPDAARDRRDVVLALMAEQGYLSRDEARRWQQEPVPDEPKTVTEGELAPYFVEWVRRLLEERYGLDLYSKGLRIYTSLDVNMQRYALAAMRTAWSRFEELPGWRHPKYADVKAAGGSGDGETAYLQGVFIALDPNTGEVRALIGGRDFEDSKFNRAVQARRQPGSAFKLFPYTAAIASGVPASHVIFDSPVFYEEWDGTTWSPKNFSGEFEGPLTLRQALRQSNNVVAVKLGAEVGLETVAQYARRMGITTDVPRVPSMPIGAPDVVPLELTQAYGTIATLGVHVPARPILRVEDATGRVLWESRPDATRVLDPLAATIVRDMLQDVVEAGTGTAVRGLGGLSREVPAAGKTGTTSDHTDVWFLGFTTDLVAGIWFGFDRPKPITVSTIATGGGYAAPVFGEFMHNVYESELPLLPLPEPWLLPPEILTARVDRESGKLANEWCPISHVYTEKFIPGSQPREVCDLHGPGMFRAPLRGITDLLQDSILRQPPPD
jgi:1A family penicillin-binding protein